VIPDQAILDVVDPTDAVRAARVVDALDQLDRRESLAIERYRDPTPRSRRCLDGDGASAATVHSNASAGGVTRGSSRTPVSHDGPAG
jgi:hypothetical protein